MIDGKKPEITLPVIFEMQEQKEMAEISKLWKDTMPNLSSDLDKKLDIGRVIIVGTAGVVDNDLSKIFYIGHEPI